ncbi:alpha/beta hydrolase [Maribellus maritimus]|uniref:alpha/beta hydrolase n=1 Tax=Maribellus maritimus TaxID=2870838 RepID=UPI001EECA8EB|nr:alpha/beta hydrolase [Maribellus maritimus]MCG6186376.1 alpha/beta hydrolase [Maribellus maritimus]
MASLKSKVFIGLMRNRHFFKGRLQKETMGWDVQSVLKFRASCEKGAERFGKLPKGIQIKPEVINMVTSEWIVPANTRADKLIFYVHGGGYVSGSCNDHRNIVSKIALQTGMTNLLYEYGLAPENPYPAALNDSVKVYEAVLEKGYKPENIIIMGESAGGGLCLATLLALRDKKIPLPNAAVAIQPWTDLSCSGASYKTKNSVSLAPHNSWNVFSHYYTGKNDVKSPYISPLAGDLSGLPPVFISAGEADELFDDSKSFYEKAKKAGNDITFKPGKEMIHCYPLLSPFFPEATEAMNEIVTFVHKHALS